jgi:AcrR family transcriptional regulator
MADCAGPKPMSRRLPSEERREEILAAAGRAVSDQGFLPVPFEHIAREAGASKALIYAYFPTQKALYNALLERALRPLAAALVRPLRGGFEAQAIAGALIYFDDVAAHGALLHLLFTDAYLDGARSTEATNTRNALWRRFARASRTYLDLPPGERVAAIAILLAMPEEMGRLAYRGDMARSRARELCRRLVLSSLRGLRGSRRAKAP